MYDKFHLQEDIFLYLCLSFKYQSGSLGCARSAQQNIGGYVAKARSAHLNSAESGKNVPGGTPE
jgi:hypothetical protein